MHSSDMPSKRPKISVLVRPEIRADIEEWAKEEGRTLSNLCERIFEAALEERKKKKNQNSPNS